MKREIDDICGDRFIERNSKVLQGQSHYSLKRLSVDSSKLRNYENRRLDRPSSWYKKFSDLTPEHLAIRDLISMEEDNDGSIGTATDSSQILSSPLQPISFARERARSWSASTRGFNDNSISRRDSLESQSNNSSVLMESSNFPRCDQTTDLNKLIGEEGEGMRDVEVKRAKDEEDQALATETIYSNTSTEESLTLSISFSTLRSQEGFKMIRVDYQKLIKTGRHIRRRPKGDDVYHRDFSQTNDDGYCYFHNDLRAQNHHDHGSKFSKTRDRPSFLKVFRFKKLCHIISRGCSIHLSKRLLSQTRDNRKYSKSSFFFFFSIFKVKSNF
ncbi:hypothetical protein BY996DRAFT_1842911 [Phakopsora pachyrhizi]|nr:hypothetical protein BY996DRAFT_1842911 [Phakopsora pachyrhizi]